MGSDLLPRLPRRALRLAPLLLAVLSACAPASPAPPRQVVGEFIGLMDAGSGQLHLRMLPDPSAVAWPAPADLRLLVSIPNGPGADTVSLATVAGTISSSDAAGAGQDPTGNGTGRSTGCGKPSSYCGEVTLTSSYATAELHDVFVEITEVTGSYEGFTSTVPGSSGLSATYGLWAYPALQDSARAPGNAATRTWRFNMPAATSFTFRGRVMANVVPLAGAAGTPSATTGICGASPGANTSLTTTTACGECGLACPAGATCAWPKADAIDPTPPCVCATGLTLCDSASRAGYATRRCVDLQRDASSCGACGTVCGASAPKCQAGRCVAQATGRTILVIAPHPDDETLLAAGRTRAALNAGDTAVIAVMTNGGEADSLSRSATRQVESVGAAALLGLPERRVIFLGYSGGTLGNLFGTPDPATSSTVYTAANGQTSTFGTRGLGLADYHTNLTGSAGAYARDTLVADLQALFLDVRPDEIYTTSYFDEHPDHEATGLLVLDALLALKRAGTAVTTKVYLGLVWHPGSTFATTGWPYAGPGSDPTYPGFTPTLAFTAPPNLSTSSTLEWARAVHFAQPTEMLATSAASNLKLQAINAYSTQTDPVHFPAFARTDEFFWLKDLGANLAASATVSASSEDWPPHNGAARATDGVVGGQLVAGQYWQEWKAGGRDGEWLQLAWPSPVTLTQVNLYDRVAATENVLTGTLSFSDGSSVAVTALPTTGLVKTVTFPARAVSWARFTVNTAQGTQTGLAEIEAFGP